MSYLIEFSPKAQKEFYRAWSWYEKELPGLGDRFEIELFKKIDLVKEHPFHYPLKKGVREAITDTFPYLLCF